MTVVKAMVNAAKMMFSPTSVNNIQHVKAPIYLSSNISNDDFNGAANGRSSAKEVSLNSSSKFPNLAQDASLADGAQSSEASDKNVITEQSPREEYTDVELSGAQYH